MTGSSRAGAGTDTGASTNTGPGAPVGNGRYRRWGSFYVAEHRLRAMRAYLRSLLVTAFGNPLIYLFGLGVGLARLVSANVDGATYLQFVAPALLSMAAITVASEEFSYPVLAGFKWNHIFEGMNSAPISPTQIVNGMIIGVVCRMVPTVTVYYLFMLLFGAVPRPLGVLAILFAVLTGLATGIPVMAFTSTIRDDRGQMNYIQRFILIPMSLFSGTYFPLSHLPIYLQWIGWISPLWHGAQLGRIASFGISEPLWLTVVHVVYLLLLIVASWIFSARSFAKRLNA